jgi:hypothetical protein
MEGTSLICISGLQIDQMGEREIKSTKRVMVGKPAAKGHEYGLQGEMGFKVLSGFN